MMARARRKIITRLSLTQPETIALRALLTEFIAARTTRDDQGAILVLGQVAKDLDWEQIKAVNSALHQPELDEHEEEW
jgi:hypothetical protein